MNFNLQRKENQRLIPYFSDYKMHFFPQIWEEMGVSLIVQM